MDILANVYTDAGNFKSINQDSACIKIADTIIGKIAMAAVCDGVGGLYKGELASATVVRDFSKWFEINLPQILQKLMVSGKKDNWKIMVKEIKTQWQEMMQQINHKLVLYGQKEGRKLGTTASVILLLDRYCYLAIHAGDSRIYLLRDQVQKLTRDHTVSEREVAMGRISREEAVKDPRRHILLQCIGGTDFIEPDIIINEVKTGDIFLLCTDGFYNMISEEEIEKQFCINQVQSEQDITNILMDITKKVKEQGEKDNITGAVLKII